MAAVEKEAGNPVDKTCDLRSLTEFLDGDRAVRTILASVNYGPEILYRTRHRVVATMHHRNEPGIADSQRIFGTPDEALALALIRRRAIDRIVVCPGYSGNHYVRRGDTGPLLYRRLDAGTPPSWLAEIPLPPSLSGAFRLYAVQPED